MIRCIDLVKEYHVGKGTRRVLDHISFEVQRGEKLAVLGRNGAGKSTLIKVIGGVELATSGRVERTMSVSWPLGFGGAFQGSLTGADNARFIARIYRKPIAQVLDYVEAFAELGHYLNNPVKTYYSGMRARLAFAVSLAIEFDCYIVDEVTAVGDSTFRERCEAALSQRRASGTLIMVSHDAHTLRAYCEAGAILREGRLTFFRSIDETIAAYDELFVH